MKFTFAHNNVNVFDLDRSLAFYREALGLTEVRRIVPADGSFIIVYLGDGSTPHRLELTWMRDRTEPYNLGDNEIHLALVTDEAGFLSRWKSGFRIQSGRQRQATMRDMLHAFRLVFVHPRTGKRLQFEAPRPEDFLDALAALRPVD